MTGLAQSPYRTGGVRQRGQRGVSGDIYCTKSGPCSIRLVVLCVSKTREKSEERHISAKAHDSYKIREFPSDPAPVGNGGDERGRAEFNAGC